MKLALRFWKVAPDMPQKTKDFQCRSLEGRRLVVFVSAMLKQRPLARLSDRRSGGRGILADLLVLDASPLTVEPAAIKDISVLRTVKEGTTVFSVD